MGLNEELVEEAGDRLAWLFDSWRVEAEREHRIQELERQVKELLHAKQ